MTAKNNPYTIGFGRIPKHYISRDLLMEDIIGNLDSDEVTGQAYKITGIRGTGKTVTLTAIERQMREDDRWIVAGIRPDGNIIEDIIGNIYNEVPFLSSFFKKEITTSL